MYHSGTSCLRISSTHIGQSPALPPLTFPFRTASMILKLIVHDKDRPSAIAKMRSALGELVIEGITTNVDFQYELIGDRDFEDGNVDTDFIPSHFPDC